MNENIKMTAGVIGVSVLGWIFWFIGSRYVPAIPCKVPEEAIACAAVQMITGFGVTVLVGLLGFGFFVACSLMGELIGKILGRG